MKDQENKRLKKISEKGPNNEGLRDLWKYKEILKDWRKNRENWRSTRTEENENKDWRNQNQWAMSKLNTKRDWKTKRLNENK